MRLFICDPVCVLPYGHNAVALNYFRRAFANRYETIALCGAALPSALASGYSLVPFFAYYYQQFIPLPATTVRTESLLSDAHVVHVDRLESLATRDAIRLLSEYDVGGDDAVFFPGADFYGLVGLLNALQQWPEAKRPRLLLRFIGVMETATHTHRNPMQHLALRLEEAKAQGVRISFSAETPRLAVHLSGMLDAVVLVTPYPEMADALAPSASSKFVVFCPGAARFDKGFLGLRSIFTEVRRADESLTIGFVTQSLSARDAEAHQNYISQLYAIPGVELLPPSITSREMAEQYRNCSAVLLPYDVDVYRMRGSAVLMEAACLGRPIVTIDGSAFAEQVSYYGLGVVVENVDGMARAILSMAKADRMKLHNQALHARQRFALDVVGAYDNWLRSSI